MPPHWFHVTPAPNVQLKRKREETTGNQTEGTLQNGWPARFNNHSHERHRESRDCPRINDSRGQDCYVQHVPNKRNQWHWLGHLMEVSELVLYLHQFPAYHCSTATV